MAYDMEKRQRYNMGLGKGSMPSGDNHGCQSLASTTCGDKSHPDSIKDPTVLGDGSRSGPPHISRGGGKMPATAHSDHGPHY